MSYKFLLLKTFILVFGLFTLPKSVCYAQNYKVEYIQIINYGSRPDTVLADLLFNNAKSIYAYGKSNIKRETKDVSTGDDNNIGFDIKLNDAIGFLCYKEVNEKLFVVRDLLFTKPVIIKDIVEDINWNIDTSKQKIIGGLNCKRATGEFRGRIYEVWFTEEIPVNMGPWKLWGLPGLILEVEETNGVLTIQLKSIKISDENIEKPFDKEEITQAKFVELFKKKAENLNRYLKTLGPKGGSFNVKSKSKINVLERSLFEN